MNREKLNFIAHKYLPEIISVFCILFLGSLYLTFSIKSDTKSTLVKQDMSLSNDSVSMKTLKKIERGQTDFIKNAEKLRDKMRK